MNFSFNLPVRIISGSNCIKKNAALLSIGSSALIVSGKNGAKKSGALDDVIDALTECGVEYTIFDKITENPPIETCFEGGRLAADVGADFIIGIGDNHTRRKTQESYNVNWVSLVHPTAQIGYKASIGQGTVVMPGAIICTCAEIGRGCIVNTCASVDHECKLKDFVHVSAGVRVAGNVTIGDNTFVGIGATVSNNIEITSNCLIGAGAVVVKNITEAGTYIGVPARKLIK